MWASRTANRLSHIPCHWPRPSRRDLHRVPRHRAFLEVTGSDSVKFLQSLVTNDVERLDKEHWQQPIVFLSPTGRFLIDAMLSRNIFKPDDPRAFLIDAAPQDAGLLLKHLRFFRLSANVEITPLEGDRAPQVHQWLPDNPSPLGRDTWRCLKENCLFEVDPRHTAMGWRSITCDSHDLDHLHQLVQAEGETIFLGEESLYHVHRLLYGLGEGEKELQRNKGVPLEACLQHYNTIQMRKGCYVGQEMIARVHYKGVIRKSVFGVHLQDPAEDSWGQVESLLGQREHLGQSPCEASPLWMEGTVIRDQNQKKAGTLLSTHGQVGLAMMRLETLAPLDRLEMDRPQFRLDSSESPNVRVIKPHWWKGLEMEEANAL